MHTTSNHLGTSFPQVGRPLAHVPDTKTRPNGSVQLDDGGGDRILSHDFLSRPS
jgi:hypothetical protein